MGENIYLRGIYFHRYEFHLVCRNIKYMFVYSLANFVFG